MKTFGLILPSVLKRPKDQRLVYSGRLLQDHLQLRDVLRKVRAARWNGKHRAHICQTVEHKEESAQMLNKHQQKVLFILTCVFWIKRKLTNHGSPTKVWLCVTVRVFSMLILPLSPSVGYWISSSSSSSSCCSSLMAISCSRMSTTWCIWCVPLTAPQPHLCLETHLR